MKLVFIFRFTLGLPFVLAAWLLDINPAWGIFVVGTGNPGRSVDDFDSAAAVLRHELYLASERERELTQVTETLQKSAQP